MNTIVNFVLPVLILQQKQLHVIIVLLVNIKKRMHCQQQLVNNVMLVQSGQLHQQLVDRVHQESIKTKILLIQRHASFAQQAHHLYLQRMLVMIVHRGNIKMKTIKR